MRNQNIFTSTNVGPTNVGWYKPKTYKRQTVQMLNQDKRWTSSNVRLGQMSDSSNVGPVQMSDQYNIRLKKKNNLNFKIFFYYKVIFFY